MCGIVGYVGQQQAVDFLIEGLRRLEYRGYDSSGVVTIDDGEFEITKTAGRIDDLAAKLQTAAGSAARSAWATRAGRRTARRPTRTRIRTSAATASWRSCTTASSKTSASSRSSWPSAATTARSATDTEVIAQLVAQRAGCPRQCRPKRPRRPIRYAPLVEAVQAALAQLRGTYGLAMVFRDWPDVIVAARLGSPLVIGIGDGEHFIASDGSPLVGHTNRIVYLADHELAVVTRNSIRVIHRDEGHVRHNVKQLEIDATQVELGGFPHYMLKEIFEQPETVVAAMRGRLNRDEATAVFGGLNLTPQQLRSDRPHRAHGLRHELARGDWWAST